MKYPKYDDYDAINVDRVQEIPEDYFGEMGVPVTFLTKWAPEPAESVTERERENGVRFSLLGHIGSCSPDGYSLAESVHIRGAKKFKRLIIQRSGSSENSIMGRTGLGTRASQ